MSAKVVKEVNKWAENAANAYRDPSRKHSEEIEIPRRQKRFVT